MLRWIRRIAPRVVFHAARAFARDPVRIRASQTRVLDRLVRDDCDASLRRLGHDLQVMTRHDLAIVPLEVNLPVVAERFDAARIRDIPGLDAVDAKPLVEIETRRELLLVVRDVGGGLVMTDQVHALALRVLGEPFEVEVGIRLREAERLAVREPVAVPTDVPALHEHAAKTVLGGEVDIAARVRRRRAVLRAGRPAPRAEMHAPPDADVLRRLEPRHIAELVRLVEVENQIRRHIKRAGILGDQQHPPRRRERRSPFDLRALRGRRQHGFQPCTVDTTQPHSRVID